MLATELAEIACATAADEATTSEPALLKACKIAALSAEAGEMLPEASTANDEAADA
ncbi:hypothetical protein WOSG25_130420 [Weissella oryzae SG25]|uniref:Uncharacterized protein n=1 Tax=Weissella oryzae (strain DSM 25784 / JCM 18191 / LMG 30913 / SG25) TaxID=1329250 RepID=A0A069CV60_WEIOS|nr:hypothetical protein WOSG25_130420 [Weissella oryzae SG25]